MRFHLILLLFVFCNCALSARQASRFLVDTKGMNDDYVKYAFLSHGLHISYLKRIGSSGFVLVNLVSFQDVDNVKYSIGSKGLFVEEDFVVTGDVVPNDVSYSKLWAMTKISAPSAWDVFTGNHTIKVCIIDSGIDFTHSDLAANVVSFGFNAINGTYNGLDDNGHGTHCAGTIAGVGNNSIGVAGVSWGVQLLGCKFLNSSNRGYVSDAIECIKYCRNQGARITSNSWAGGDFSQALYNEIAIEQANDNLFVVAAGNENKNIDKLSSYPASFDLINIISVCASTQIDSKSLYSNYGKRHVDLCAPGDNIFSTVPGSNYKSLSGTSMAAPHVAGAAALIWQYSPSFSASQIKHVLLNSVDIVSDMLSYSVTGGRLNVWKALSSAMRDIRQMLLSESNLNISVDMPPNPAPRCCKYNKRGVCEKICDY
jgi:subtilisin family serine protease